MDYERGEESDCKFIPLASLMGHYLTLFTPEFNTSRNDKSGQAESR